MRIICAATGVAALGVIGAAAMGVTDVASVAPSVGADVALAAVGAPSPQNPPPAPNLPSPDQSSSLCTQATDPGVSYTTRTNLVQNGISPDEGHLADHDLRKA